MRVIRFLILMLFCAMTFHVEALFLRACTSTPSEIVADGVPGDDELPADDSDVPLVMDGEDDEPDAKETKHASLDGDAHSRARLALSACFHPREFSLQLSISSFDPLDRLRL